jgi:predicted secreted protein
MSNAVATTGTLVKRKSLGAAISTSSVADPTVITTPTPHGLASGESATIAGHTGSTPALDGTHVVTVLSPTTFTVPVNVTVAGAGGTVAADAYTTIGEVTKVTPPGKSRNKIETSTHNDGTESFILGILRQKDCSFTINYLADNPTHMAINTDIDANLRQSWQIVFPSGITFTGPARVQQFTPADAPVDGAQQADVTLAWAGPIVQS